MLLAEATGIFVPLFEWAATAIAAGAVVGGFAGATGGFLSGWSRKQVERDAPRDGYIGAALAVAALLLDLCIVYATSL
jgi:hypothetical protein